MAATKDVTIGMTTKETEAEQKDKAESFIPSMQDLLMMQLIISISLFLIAICDPTCVYGACVSNDTCYCSNGYDGEICDIAGLWMLTGLSKVFYNIQFMKSVKRIYVLMEPIV